MYKGRKIVIAPSAVASRVLGRHGSAGRNWTVSIDGEDIVDRISYVRFKDENLIMIAVKKYVDKLD